VVVKTNTIATAVGSLPDPAYSYEWTFGDGTPAVFGASATHSWGAPGGYQVHLNVYDSAGQSASASAPVAVTSSACPAPPSVKIVANGPLTGTDGLDVSLSADWQGDDPTPVLRWELGDGASAVGHDVSHHFEVGSY